MPQKTIYVREKDNAIWQEAEKLADKSLSSLLVNLLKKFVDEKRQAKGIEQQGMERIEVLVIEGRPDIANNVFNLHLGKGLRQKTQVFTGRWLVEDMRSSNLGIDKLWSVAITAKGKIAVYSHGPLSGGQPIKVYDNLDEADLPNVVYAAVAEKLGIPLVEELDI
jgi:hypothetical protein